MSSDFNLEHVILFHPGALHAQPTLIGHGLQRAPVPVPEYEEEVEASPEAPTLAQLESEGKRRHEKLSAKRDAPHLMFEISSTDGFHVRAESWQGIAENINKSC